MKKKERKLTLKEQIENIPEAVMDADRNAYNSGEISLAELQESWISSGYMDRGYNQICNFRTAIAKHGFKQRKSHGLLSDHPEYLTLFDWEKNNAEGIFPEKLSLGSGKQAWFKCQKNLHESEKRRIVDHIAGHGCSKCRDEATGIANSTPIKGVNDLASKRPDLVPLWSDRNDRQPDEVCYAANDKYLFIGQNGFEYPNVVKDRVKLDADWCPFSSWQRRMPSHYEVYSFIRNLLPDWVDVFTDQEILPSSGSGPQQNQVDIYIPFFRIAIEVNGDEHLNYGAEYHDSKVDRAEQIGVTLHQVWVSTWNDGTNQWQNKLKNIFEANLSYMTGTSGDKVVPFADIEIKENIIYRSGDAA